MSEAWAGNKQRDTYTTVAIILHWVIAFAIMAQIFFGLQLEDLPKAEKFQAFQMHKSMGLTILILSVARLLWRFANPPPALPEGMKGWEIAAAKLTHVGFYVMMIGIPVTGWVMISTAPYNIATMWWGLFEWPKLPLADLPFRKLLNEGSKESHEILAKLTIALWALHVGAALKHYIIDKDSVLARMLPFLKPLGAKKDA